MYLGALYLHCYGICITVYLHYYLGELYLHYYLTVEERRLTSASLCIVLF